MTSSETLLKQLNWDKREERRKLHKAKLWFRLQNNKMEGVDISLSCHKDVHITMPGTKAILNCQNLKLNV